MLTAGRFKAYSTRASASALTLMLMLGMSLGVIFQRQRHYAKICKKIPESRLDLFAVS